MFLREKFLTRELLVWKLKFQNLRSWLKTEKNKQILKSSNEEILKLCNKTQCRNLSIYHQPPRFYFRDKKDQKLSYWKCQMHRNFYFGEFEQIRNCYYSTKQIQVKEIEISICWKLFPKSLLGSKPNCFFFFCKPSV